MNTILQSCGRNAAPEEGVPVPHGRRRYELFIFRHELAHISPRQINMINDFVRREVTLPRNRKDMPWEVDASNRALRWMRER